MAEKRRCLEDLAPGARTSHQLTKPDQQSFAYTTPTTAESHFTVSYMSDAVLKSGVSKTLSSKVATFTLG
ncbi:hypothetical protein AMELA_G00247730 [Ameiurus melas]|uniref:Uncharacterized protein n=1 Tax=Ameiurus melas TaxID=219545 RepID=A0A7J5ZTP2_AMEME|nr:hypothetical protein AMELA_G00247730 [Ameiurus melas]